MNTMNKKALRLKDEGPIKNMLRKALRLKDEGVIRILFKKKAPVTRWSIIINEEYEAPQYNIFPHLNYEKPYVHVVLNVATFEELETMKALIQQRLPEALRQIRNGFYPNDVIMREQNEKEVR